jgi:tetraacyldisaccharide 4'-kinase
VPLDEPSWWYGAREARLPTLLAPLGALYGWVAKARFTGTSPYHSRLPVICVGNLTAGGSGKTPLVIHLCEHLKAGGHAPAVLTRGYGGRGRGPHWVNNAVDKAYDVGDEPLLLARTAPTLVARDRRAGARAIEQARTASVIVMDDGLQNPHLAKDLCLAVVDGERGLGNERVIPAGPLRAPLSFQLDITDAVVVNTTAGGQPDERVADALRRRFPGPVLRATTAPAEDTRWLEAKRIVAWAGIGAPQRFFGLLRWLGAEIAEEVAFRDHQRLGPVDAERLLGLARRNRAALVTTEKDMARLAGSEGVLAELAKASRTVPIRITLGEADAERLSALIASVLQSRT